MDNCLFSQATGTMEAVAGILAVWLSVGNTPGNGLVEFSSAAVHVCDKGLMAE